MDKEKISFHRLPLNDFSLNLPIVEEAFCLFEKVWNPEYLDIYGKELAGSNEFLFNDHIMIVCVNRVVKGLMLSRDVDLAKKIFKKQKYFSEWPKEVINYLSGFGKLEIHNHLCVCRSFLKSTVKRKESIASLVVKLSFMSYVLGDSKGVISYARNERGVDKLVEEAGADLLLNKNIMGVDSTIFHCDKIGINKNIVNGIISKEVISIFEGMTNGIEEYLRFENEEVDQYLGRVSLAG